MEVGTRRRNRAFPGKLARSNASAAGIPKSKAISIAAAATCKLFRTESQSAASLNKMRYQLRVRLRGGKPPTPCPLEGIDDENDNREIEEGENQEGVQG